MLTFPSEPTTCGTPLQTTGLASASSENQLPSSSVEYQLSVFFQIPKILSPSLPGMTSFMSPVHFLSGFFILTSVIVTSSPRAREHLHSICALKLTHALSRKVLSLTKPKGKIHKMKNDNIKKKIPPHLYNIGNGVGNEATTPWCGSYRKGRIGANLDYGRQLYFTSGKQSIYFFKFTVEISL